MNIPENFVRDAFRNAKLQQLAELKRSDNNTFIFEEIIQLLRQANGVATLREIYIRANKEKEYINTYLEKLKNIDIVFMLNPEDGDRSVIRLCNEFRCEILIF